jgi:hypothetical protein
LAAAAAGDGWLGAALAVGAERGVGFFSGVEVDWRDHIDKRV